MIGTHERAGRCCYGVGCAACVLLSFSCCFCVLSHLWCGVLSQHFIPSQHFAVHVLFISRSPHGFWRSGVRHVCVQHAHSDFMSFKKEQEAFFLSWCARASGMVPVLFSRGILTSPLSLSLSLSLSPNSRKWQCRRKRWNS
jgi:hypothetical protein